MFSKIFFLNFFKMISKMFFQNVSNMFSKMFSYIKKVRDVFKKCFSKKKKYLFSKNTFTTLKNVFSNSCFQKKKKCFLFFSKESRIFLQKKGEMFQKINMFYHVGFSHQKKNVFSLPSKKKNNKILLKKKCFYHVKKNVFQINCFKNLLPFLNPKIVSKKEEEFFLKVSFTTLDFL